VKGWQTVPDTQSGGGKGPVFKTTAHPALQQVFDILSTLLSADYSCIQLFHRTEHYKIANRHILQATVIHVS